MPDTPDVCRARSAKTITHSLVYVCVAVTSVALLLSGCGSMKKSASAPTVTTVVNPQLGTILATDTGMVLYTYTADSPGKTGCTGTCLQYWPPLLLGSGVKHPVAGPGVSGLGTFARPEGGTQVTYNGMPLYTYVTDTQPNEATGQRVVDAGGTWYVVSLSPPAVPSSTPTTANAASTSTTAAHVTTTTTVVASHAASPTTASANTSPTTAARATTIPPITAPTTAPPGGGVSY
jgi:predicted lipoprotein with Yx(FWY)xxD motif